MKPQTSEVKFSDKMKKEPSTAAEKTEKAKAEPEKKKSGFADFWNKASKQADATKSTKPAQASVVPKKVSAEQVVPKKVSAAAPSKPEETKGNKPQIPAAPAWRNG